MRRYHRTLLVVLVALVEALDLVMRAMRAARKYVVISAARHSAEYWRLS